MRHSTEEVIERLRVLHDKLEDEGRYVQANTVWLAIEEIANLEVSPEGARLVPKNNLATETLKALRSERDQMAEAFQRAMDDCTELRNEVDRLKYLLAEDDWG